MEGYKKGYLVYMEEDQEIYLLGEHHGEGYKAVVKAQCQNHEGAEGDIQNCECGIYAYRDEETLEQDSSEKVTLKLFGVH